jgi:hypothetical protein
VDWIHLPLDSLVESSCECGNKPSNSIKGGEFHEQLSIRFSGRNVWSMQLAIIQSKTVLTKLLYAFLISPMCAICPNHLILLDIITTISGEENKL